MAGTSAESDEENPVERTLKVVVVGDGASGKTSICTCALVWDIGGQSLAGPMLDKYLYGAHGCLAVYDVTNTSSFDNLDDWIQVVRQYTKNQEKPLHLAIVGNKTDLENRRAIRIERHQQLAERERATSHYVSAKTGDSVVLMFKQVAAEILGMKLTKTEQEQEVAVVTAQIEQHPERKTRSAVEQRSRKSSICSLQ